MAHPYLISKFADPIFAFLIGSSSAVLRIQKDMREQLQARTPLPSPSPTTAAEATTASAATTTAEEKAAAAKNADVGISEIASIGARRVRRWWRGEFQGL